MLISSFTAFLVKSALCSAIMLAYYWLFLRNRNLHQYNRFYLLSTVVVSLVIPFLHFEWYQVQAPTSEPMFKMLEVTAGGSIEAEITTVDKWQAYQSLLLPVAYNLVALVMLALLVVKIAWVYRLKRKYEVTRMNRFDMVHTQLSNAPFSFLNNLFWRDDINIETTSGRQILQHELVHIKQKHTWDKLAIQLVSAICWLNPCYWMIQKELAHIHEFIADEEAIKDKDTEAFARMLLQTHYGNQFGDVVHPFFNSSIKRRLSMISKLSKPKYAYLRRLMVLPVLAATVFLFSFKVNKDNVTRSGKRIILALDAGHGGNDNGAVTSSGLVEKDLNQRIANRIKKMAAESNIQVVPTYSNNEYVPLLERPAIANRANADVLVSIHVNGSSDNEVPTRASGYEIILDERSPNAYNGRVLASAISGRLNTQNLQPVLREKHLAVLKDAKMPAILIECGYINNSTEMAIIANDEQLDKLCRNILNGVVDYHNNKR